MHEDEPLYKRFHEEIGKVGIRSKLFEAQMPPIVARYRFRAIKV